MRTYNSLNSNRFYPLHSRFPARREHAPPAIPPAELRRIVAEMID